MIETEDQVTGRRMKPSETFRFQCRPDLDCFNTCCRNKRLMLLPYDVLRLRRSLSLPSQQILAELAELELDPNSGWPALRLKLQDDGRCPFVRTHGCAVYPHRPGCCRIFPLARAVALGQAGQPPHEFFVVTETRGCLGWDEPRDITVQQWIEEQGLEDYRKANNRLLSLLMHPHRPRPMELSERQVHGVVMALYNLDVFREAVTLDGFARRFGLEQERLEAALLSDESLLELGQDWLSSQLFAD